MVKARLAARERRAAAPRPAPAHRPAVPDAQRPMIEGMVSRLATRLATQRRQRRRVGAPYSRLFGAASDGQGQGGARRGAQGARPATAARSQVWTRSRANSASEARIDPPRPPPDPDRGRPRRRRRGGGDCALCAQRQHRVLLQPERSRPRKRCAPGARLRVGGLVKANSVVKSADETLAFVVTDGAHDLKVAYQRPAAGPVPRGSGRRRRGRAGRRRQLARRDHSRQA